MTTNLARLAVAATTFTLLAGPSVGKECDLTTSFSESVDPAGVTRVIINAKAGFLTVTGGSREIRAQGTACASKQSVLDGIQLDVARSGATVRITARIPRQGWGFSHSPAKLDMTIELPSGIAVEIDDGSGPIEVSDIGSLRIEDGSGSIRISRIIGDVEIEDGSGSIDIESVDGSLELTDGSGSIDIAGLAGNARISDGSGNMDLTDVTGDVHLEDGSGGIVVRRVEGSVIVERDGSGGIDVRDVRGDLSVERDGSGGIHHDNIGGRIDLP